MKRCFACTYFLFLHKLVFLSCFSSLICHCFIRFPADFDVGEVSAYNMWQLFVHDLGDFLEGSSRLIHYLLLSPFLHPMKAFIFLPFLLSSPLLSTSPLLSSPLHFSLLPSPPLSLLAYFHQQA